MDDRLHASVEELSTLLAREGRARAEFIGKVSHELQTPLTVMETKASSQYCDDDRRRS